MNNLYVLAKGAYIDEGRASVRMKGNLVKTNGGFVEARRNYTGLSTHIMDTGIGMTKEEMIEHLGTIAKSGSKAFLSELSKASEASAKSSIIGQFGVGFYSSFMVSDKVEVFSKSYKPGSVGHKWTSDGQGKFEISEAENVQRGTKIVLHLKMDSHEFCQEDVIKDVTKKYSNFVGAPIYVGGKKANTIQC
ncbi:heat shock protein 75 kDa, mitochondrial-like [Lingula anatina]|uniref:Heat shock protein 75 kDa, mitochondrial-like n=1 Tax=Lingula anatina TaxID=7574 RepID=A0A1S3K1I2_LINAN|nr:heat shock protein 75 kDa, mitochondrial-like [Lingula anatina]|eukprot:XP_013416493.1 heat shock protein 75 kDa, mitochondrial-like [Lingula anatina]